MTSNAARRAGSFGTRSILLTFASLSWQKGSAAQVISLVRELRKVRSDVRFVLLSHCPELDSAPAQDLGIEVVGPRLSSRSQKWRNVVLLSGRLRCAWQGFRNRRPPGRTRREKPDALAHAYERANFVIDLSGDSYRDPPGGFAPAHHANFLAALATGTPFALASQSVGPFRSYNRQFARYLLRRAAFLYIRERKTAQILSQLGVAPEQIRIAPDVAFVLPAESPTPIWRGEELEPARIRRPWIAVSVSLLAAKLAARGTGNVYLEEMTRLCQHLHRRYGASVFLVPHEIKAPGYGLDDRSVGRALSARLMNPSWAFGIQGDYAPGCLKGFIRQCDALVAARMHAAIAGLSSGVPTLPVAWSHKYEGLMEEIELGDYVWNQNRPSLPLPGLFDRLWSDREQIRGRLLRYTAWARTQIASTVEDLARHIDQASISGCTTREAS